MDKWSDNKLIAAIETFGFQMAEMGRQNTFASNASLEGDYDGMRMYTKNAEMIREAANELKKEIAAQIVLRDSEVAKVA